jgi:hypothetical protein
MLFAIEAEARASALQHVNVAIREMTQALGLLQSGAPVIGKAHAAADERSEERTASKRSALAAIGSNRGVRGHVACFEIHE